MNEKTLRLDDLQCKGLKIYQSSDLYTFTSDAVLLANFSKVCKDDKVLEIGSGCGVVSFLIAAKREAEVIGIELQESLYQLSEKSRLYNALTNPRFFCMRAQEATEVFGKNSFDAVVCNPPYFKSAPSMQSENQSVRLAKHECELTFEEIADISSMLLKSGGDFYMVAKAQRLCECVYALSQKQLQTKELTLIVPKSGKCEADSFLLRARKNAKQGARVKAITLMNDKNILSKEGEELTGKERNE